MGVSNFTGPRESKLTIPRARKMAKPSKIPRIVNEIPGNLRANSQEKAVKLERKNIHLPLCVEQFKYNVGIIMEIRAISKDCVLLSNLIFSKS